MHFYNNFFFSFPTTAHRRHLLFSVIRRQNRLAHARTIIIIIIIQIDASRARARACCNNDMTLKKKYGIVRVYNNIILYCIHYTYKTILLCTGPAYRHRQGQTRGTTTRAAVTRTQEDFWLFLNFFSLLSGHSKPVAARIKRNRFSTDVFFFCILSFGSYNTRRVSLSLYIIYNINRASDGKLISHTHIIYIYICGWAR